MSNEHGITGNWKGHYTYQTRPDEGSNFDAIFVEHEASLKGEIRDEGILGHAVVEGSFAYPSVSFTKTYYELALDPISYQGTMSGDGKTITGKWTIISKNGLSVKGSWMAHRTDLDEQKKQKVIQRAKQDLENVR